MALEPNDSRHALQIQAGIAGRIAGHYFETALAETINNLPCPILQNPLPEFLINGSPEISIVKKALKVLGLKNCHIVDILASASY